mmetsp:Transcript_81019/g.234943  ORF Transcript_81019/g.234943 Transcript_81019/m.234943 type:complete len:290 (-) Transcript_81019:589-1458(-)
MARHRAAGEAGPAGEGAARNATEVVAQWREGVAIGKRPGPNHSDPGGEETEAAPIALVGLAGFGTGRTACDEGSRHIAGCGELTAVSPLPGCANAAENSLRATGCGDLADVCCLRSDGRNVADMRYPREDGFNAVIGDGGCNERRCGDCDLALNCTPASATLACKLPPEKQAPGVAEAPHNGVAEPVVALPASRVCQSNGATWIEHPAGNCEMLTVPACCFFSGLRDAAGGAPAPARDPIVPEPSSTSPSPLWGNLPACRRHWELDVPDVPQAPPLPLSQSMFVDVAAE